MNFHSKSYWLVCLLLVVTGSYVHILRYTRVGILEQVDLAQLPTHLADWRLEQSIGLGQATEEILRSDQHVWRRYVNSQGRSLGFFVAYFKDQKYGAQIHSPVHCVPGGGWKIVDRGVYQLKIGNPEPCVFNINKMINSNGRYHEMMLYWFWTRSGIITSEYQLKLDLAKNALFRKPTDAAIIRLNLLLANHSQTETLQIATSFIEAIFPALQQTFPFPH